MIFNTIAIIIALIFVFLFAIRKFSQQIERVDGEQLKSTLTSLTVTPLRGTLVGTIITAALQSSTAVSVMTVGLVNAGVLSFYHSLGIIFGSHIGTTFATQLIAFKLTYIAPYILIFGFILERFGKTYSKYGKAVFYFGMVFLSLALISQIALPLQDNPFILSLVGEINNFWVALFVGIVMTVVFQSSALITGIVIILVGSGLLTLEQAFGIVMGANIGTTSTVLIASVGMNLAARRSAAAHVLFSVLGVVIFIPFIEKFTQLIYWIGGPAGLQVANFHMIFNIISAVIFLLFIKPFARLVEGIVYK